MNRIAPESGHKPDARLVKARLTLYREQRLLGAPPNLPLVEWRVRPPILRRAAIVTLQLALIRKRRE